MRWMFFLFVLSVSVAFSLDTLLAKPIKAIVVFSDEKDQIKDSNELKKMKGVSIYNLSLVISKYELTQALQPYIGTTLTESKIRQMKMAIVSYFKSKGFPLLYVMVPEQEITEGVIQLRVIESKLGSVKIEGGTKATQNIIKKYVDYKPGSLIDENALLTDVSFTNRNPFRRVGLIYQEGKNKNTTDVFLPLEERKIWRLYVGAENTGLVTTGRQRWIAGINFGRIFGLDDTFAYQFTQATEIKRFQAHTAQYLALLPWKNLLNLYGGYSRIHANLPVPNYKNTGTSGQASVRYIFLLPSRPFLDHEVNIGFDYKITNNNFDVSEFLEPVTNYVNLSQFVVSYGLKYQKGTARASCEAELYFSPGRMMSHQADAYFNNLRAGAKNTWVYGKILATYWQRFAYDFGVFLKAEAQWSSATLLPSEQYGLGGASSVRGYDEREINKDNAVEATAEIFSPDIKLFGRPYKKVKDALQFIYFVDYGWGDNHTPVFGEKKAQYLAGTGPGIRYTWDPYFSAKLDWGIRLHHNKEQFGDGKYRIHFSLVLSY